MSYGTENASKHVTGSHTTTQENGALRDLIIHIYLWVGDNRLSADKKYVGPSIRKIRNYFILHE
jgi:hypothetical protein